MISITDEFKKEAKLLAEMYASRKELVEQITIKELRIRELGIMIEYTDSLENNVFAQEENIENEVNNLMDIDISL